MRPERVVHADNGSTVAVTADAVAVLMARGVLPFSAASVTRCADALEIRVVDIRDALERWDAKVRPILSRQAAQRSTPASAAANPVPGMRRCCRCRRVLPVAEFNVKNKRTGALRSMCRACQKAYQRARYLSTEQLDAGVYAFEAAVLRRDGLVGEKCASCGKPILPGQHVKGVAVLGHADCPDVPALRTPATPPHVAAAAARRGGRAGLELVPAGGDG